eukprot:GHUV01017765.1.p1 GENE.GHUV01017765.1~~GHUV01017765.1.p1  ORF type:complete len:234 (+),score=30.50 GHUV01017765.1:183-884(+)
MRLHSRTGFDCLHNAAIHATRCTVRPCHRTSGSKLVCSLQPSQDTSQHRSQLQQPRLGQESLELLLTYAGKQLPSQADELCSPSDRGDEKFVALADKPSTRSIADLDYLSELLAIQQNDGPKNLGFFGTRNMGMTHQKLVEILSYAMVSTGNHIYTSGATGTNAAVIKGALRAEQPQLLTVILPQSRSKQPQESRELLEQVGRTQLLYRNSIMSRGQTSSSLGIAWCMCSVQA